MTVERYQFYISFNDKVNTAASKAVQDCKSVLASFGYQDFSIEDIVLPDRFYLFKILYRTIKFYFLLKTGSIVAVQYPLLSGNSLFKYFIKAARFKGVRFFCIIHDIDDLRYNSATLNKCNDVNALNNYDCVIVHNTRMKQWLLQQKLAVPLITLKVFDYLTVKNKVSAFQITSPQDLKIIAFAGNLSKSNFIYSLNKIDGWYFNLYGPNYKPELAHTVNNICWHGSLSPDEILSNMRGAFGLIWDGEFIDSLDELNGKYLKFNNPHKLSLYLAAGLPVIAPQESAIGAFITEHKIGVLINNLTDLNSIDISEDNYKTLRKNVLHVSDKIKNGDYISSAITDAEECLETHAYSKKIVYS